MVNWLGRVAALGLVLCCVVVPGCGGDDGSPSKPSEEAGAAGDGNGEAGAGAGGEAGAGAPIDAFTAWKEARVALRTSPDHLSARADAVVASKDAQRIFEFVRDEIVTYPPAIDGFRDAVTTQRWGVRGTLRGGAGTPREKAELLVSLYARAGFDARVVSGLADPALLDGEAVLLRATERNYAPKISPAQAASWRTALGHDRVPTYSTIDEDGSETRALADSLLAQLPDTLSAPFDFTLEDIPLVSVEVDGEPLFANPIAPGAKLGDSLTLDEPLPAGDATPPQSISIKVEGVLANAPLDRFTLVEREYATEDVVGRKIHLSFPSPVPVEELATTRLDAVTSFVPLLNVAAPDLPAEDRERLAELGHPLTIGGDVYTIEADDSLSLNGVPLAAAVTSPNAAKAVAGISATADAAAFPEVTLRVRVSDSSDKGVPRLPASAIDITDAAAAVPFSIARNEAAPPRVVLLFDLSTSLPIEFRGAGAVTLATSIIQPLYAAYPNAEVRVANIFFGANWLGSTWATSEALALTQAAELATAPGGSEIFQTLAQVSAEKPTIVILVTDGDSTDEIEAGFRDDIAGGAPVIALGAGTVVQGNLDAIASLSGGSALPVASSAAATTAALAAIAASAGEDYEFHYRAPLEGPKVRTVSVEINGKRAEASYEVPEIRALPPALAGLYLTVESGGRVYSRALAGYGLGNPGTTRPQISEAMLEDVRSLLKGRVSFSVEAAAAPASVTLDDWLADKLSLQPLAEAAAAKDEPAILKALGQGFALTPGRLPLAQPPLPGAWDGESLTFETGPRLTSLVQKIHEGGPVTRQLDIWPLSRWATAASDPRIAFERTLQATASLSVNEAALFSGTSTLKDLKGAALTLVEAGKARDQAGLTDRERAHWTFLEERFTGSYLLLVPTKPGPFWAIEKATGTVIGVLADGSGGGGDSACSAYDDANRVIDALSMIGSLAGASVGGWAALAKWEVKYITVATIVIGGGSLPPGAADLSDPAGEMACGNFEDALGNLIPAVSGYGTIVTTLGDVGVDTAHIPTICGGNPFGETMAQLCQ